MKPFPHRYEVSLKGWPTGRALARAAGMPDLASAPPVEFDGPGDAWSPEHLFLAAIETCFLFTLRPVARASNLEFESLEVEATGVVHRQEGTTRFTEIVLRARLVVTPGTDSADALHVLHKTARVCLISASISTPVRLEPEIVETLVDQPVKYVA